MDERITIAEIAGYGNESTAWRMLMEMSDDLLRQGLAPLDPFRVVIEEDGHLNLSRTGQSSSNNGFEAPEWAEDRWTEPGLVWSLGATVFYVVMGRQVMNGKGGRGQQKSSKLPYLRSEWPELSELVQHCLRFDPVQRPSLREIHDIATQHYSRCLDLIRQGPKYKPSETQVQTDEGQEPDFWPEAMKNQK